MLPKERAALDAALQLAQASHDPMACANNMPHIQQLLALTQHAWQRSSGVAQRIIARSFTTPITAPSTNSSTESVTFPSPGRVVGVKAIALDQTSNTTDPAIVSNWCACSIKINGDRFLITDGQTEKFVPFSILKGQPSSGDPSQAWFPLDNLVLPSDKWFVTCAPTASDGSIPAHTITPFIFFLFESDLEAMAQDGG